MERGATQGTPRLMLISAMRESILEGWVCKPENGADAKSTTMETFLDKA
jgi:hypothetical protein